MKFKLKSGLLLGVLLLSGCGQASVSCSDDDAKSALETAIRENLEKITIERAKAEDGSQPNSNSAIRASIATIKLVIKKVLYGDSKNSFLYENIFGCFKSTRTGRVNRRRKDGGCRRY